MQTGLGKCNPATLLLEFENFAPEFLQLKNKQGEIIPFKFNAAQIKVLGELREAQAKGLPLRFIILKARQRGISTLFQAYVFHETYTNFNQKALTIGHKLEASNNLYDIFRRFYSKLPSFLQVPLEKSNEKKIRFADTESENKIDTAGEGEVGRSDTLQYLHITELAFWARARQTLTGLLQSAKYAKLIVIESTANGIGGEFHERWEDAVNGLSSYIPIFLSWLDEEEYTLTLNTDEEQEIRSDLNNSRYCDYENEESVLIEKFGATLGQIAWRRRTIDDDVKTPQLFHQEYPCTPEEAFISTGRLVFDMNICVKNAEAVKNLKYQSGNLELVIEEEKIKGVEFIPNPKGYIRLYKSREELDIIPGENFRFASGWDVAEGLEQGDYSEGSYLDRRIMEVVLTWHGHIDPDRLALEQYKIFLFLGRQDIVCTERNNHGLTTITHAERFRLNQYTEQSYTKGYDAEFIGGERTKKLGFLTTSSSKPYIIDRLAQYIREGGYYDPEVEFWKQCQTFVKDERGRMSAQGKYKDPATKCYDDKVMSRALMLECHNSYYEYYKPAPEKKRPTGREQAVQLGEKDIWSKY